MNKVHRISLGNINLDLLQTDEDIRQEAKKHVERLLVESYEAVAEDTWKAFQKSGFKPEGSKSQFIRNAGRNAKKATAQEKKNAEDVIFEQIKQMKEESERSTGLQNRTET